MTRRNLEDGRALALLRDDFSPANRGIFTRMYDLFILACSIANDEYSTVR